MKLSTDCFDSLGIAAFIKPQKKEEMYLCTDLKGNIIGWTRSVYENMKSKIIASLMQKLKANGSSVEGLVDPNEHKRNGSPREGERHIGPDGRPTERSKASKDHSTSGGRYRSFKIKRPTGKMNANEGELLKLRRMYTGR